MKRITKKALGLTIAVAGGAVLAANPSWFSVNTAYGTNGASVPLGRYGRGLAVDPNDAAHSAYSLVATPSTTGSYVGPYTIVRRTNSGSLDVTFGAGGTTTSFANYNLKDYNFHALCIDPLTHNLIVVGDYRNSVTVIERLTPPAASGAAAVDATFNPHSTHPGIVSSAGPLGAQACSVAGDQSIIVAGSRFSTTPYSAVITRFLVDGTADKSFGVNGLVTITPPNGENWETSSIAWNSAQTITPDLLIAGDTFPGLN